jgi:trehalose synthase
MFPPVPTNRRSLDDYAPLIGPEEVLRLRGGAERLRGLSVLHLSGSSFGTRLAATLATLVPLMQDLGLDAHWAVPRVTEDWAAVGRAIYEAVGGDFVAWTPDLLDTWRRYAQLNAELFDRDFDFVVIHDPQAVPIRQALGSASGNWIWHCHHDFRDAQPEVAAELNHALAPFSGVLVEHADYMEGGWVHQPMAVLAPAMDPISARNVELALEDQEQILSGLGIDPLRPLVAQCSTFDGWTDPLGAIEVYRLAKAQVPELQLVLVADMSPDDLAGRLFYEQVARKAGEDGDLHLLSSLNMVGELEINVIQRAACVNLQRRVRKGFAAGLLDASWKARPVLAGESGELRSQIVQGLTGFVAGSNEEAAGHVVDLARNPELTEEMGRAGRELVRERFLITRYLDDYLHLLAGMHTAIPA